jgi:hypothetical protein
MMAVWSVDTWHVFTPGCGDMQFLLQHLQLLVWFFVKSHHWLLITVLLEQPPPCLPA